MIKFLFSSWFKPEYSPGDKIVSSDLEFPKSTDYLIITAVGKNKYQYKFNWAGSDLYEANIWYFDSCYKLVNPDIATNRSANR